MELTKELLIKLGFESNHPERVLCNLYKASKKPEYRIDITQQYKPNSNKLEFNVNCWSGDGIAIIKRSSLSDVRTTEELQQIIELCNIDFNVTI